MKKKELLIEQGFPFEQISAVATQESWRKEINRPTSYIHKWWARRLGSVFRSLLIGAAESDIKLFFDDYYGRKLPQNKVILDPFMGSGTTVTEAVKLGEKVIGVDINPVAVGLVRTSLEKYDQNEVLNTFKKLTTSCAPQIKQFYKAQYLGKETDVLYYFWVDVIQCEDCGEEIPLFKSTIFSKNAYPSKKPQAYSICPFCWHINSVKYNDSICVCEKCHREYNPQKGNAKGVGYTCPHCGKHEKIIDYIRRKKEPLSFKMYAKMIIDEGGNKYYLDIDEYDLSLYKKACISLKKYEKILPDDLIKEGINTNQIINYRYKKWKQMFNARQLLAFGILMDEIIKIEKLELRRLFAYLMSGTLEFNNMFCSFKGEGTGAVRPLFYNHILKNELMPLEANVWGEKTSSGSFSTFFKTRILRMLDYKEHPFEIKLVNKSKSEKVFLNNCNVEVSPTDSVEKWSVSRPLILCQNSASLPLPDGCVDLIVTDPPFFDNVNYSELADFFYVWLRKMNIGIGNKDQTSTRTIEEVQDNDSEGFSRKLCNVFTEGNRLLKKDGKLIFTYHHSKSDGWVSVYNSICNSGFIIQQVFPIKAEMSVSVAIMAAKYPINYDLVFVCKKATKYTQLEMDFDLFDEYQMLLKKIDTEGLIFSEGDKKILMYGLILKQLSNKGELLIDKHKIEKVIEEWKLRSSNKCE